MKANFLLGLMAATAVGARSLKSIAMRVSSYNIRRSELSEDPIEGEELWPVRRPGMAAQLNYETAGRDNALMCFQEVVVEQLRDIDTDLGDEWTYVGVGRDDGVEAGEFAPIFYRPSTWELAENRTYWLSETPDVVGSVGWDAMYARIVNVAKFKHIETGASFVHMCTHFDHIGQVARENSAELIVSLTKEWSDHNKVPVFLGGDLNVKPDNPAYLILASKLHDVKDVVPKKHHHANVLTYTGFDGKKPGSEIDHIFVRDPEHLKWVSLAVLDNRFDNGIYLSDHRPVVVDFKMPVEGSDTEQSGNDGTSEFFTQFED